MAKQPNLLQRIGTGIAFGLSSLIGTAKADVSMSTRIYEKNTNVPVAKVMAGKPYDLRVNVNTTTMPNTYFAEANWQLVYRDYEGNALNKNEAFFVDSAEPHAYDVFLPNDFFEGATMWDGEMLFQVDTNVFSQSNFRCVRSGYPSNRNRPVANYVFHVDPNRIGATNEMFDFARDWTGGTTCRVIDSGGNQYVESRSSPYHLNVSRATFDVTYQGDITGDGKVDVSDLMVLARAWGTQTGNEGYNPVADLNGDGSVDAVDLLILAQNFGQSAN